ncbi:MAG: hypothetical protein AAFY10_06840 [Pseudomonadota bacterium]
MSDVVTRLFGDQQGPERLSQPSLTSDDFPTEKVEALVSSIVASSRPVKPVLQPVPDNAPDPAPMDVAKTTGPPQVAETDATKITLEETSPVVLVEAGAETMPLPPAEKRETSAGSWWLALAAGVGLSASAIALMLGLQRSGADDASAAKTLATSNTAPLPKAVDPKPEANVRKVQQQLTSAGPEFVSADVASRTFEPTSSLDQEQENGSRSSDIQDFAAVGAPSLPPSVKPSQAPSASAPTQVAVQRAAPPSPSLRTAQAIANAERQIPQHVHTGPVIPGSAAAMLVGIVEASGEALTPSERSDLSTQIERLLETELDGRTANIDTPDGNLAEISLVSSRFDQQNIVLKRSDSVALVDDGLFLESGWFAAKDVVAVRPLPDLQTEQDGALAGRGTLFQRMATVTSSYGDRWYLVGQGGVATGYVSAAEVTLAETFNGPLGRPFEVPSTSKQDDFSLATTRCRTIEVGLGDASAQRAEVCRHADGSWLGRAAPEPHESYPAVTTRHVADEILTRLDAEHAAEAPVQVGAELNSLLGEGFETAAFEVPTESGTVAVELGERGDQLRAVSLPRAAEIAPVRSMLTISHAWVQARVETELRPVPSAATRMRDGAVAEGQFLEVLGLLGESQQAEWAIIGRRGVAQGYIQLADLQWVKPRPELEYSAHTRLHGRVVSNRVTASTQCQTVKLGRVSSLATDMQVCAVPGGGWAVSSDRALRTTMPARVSLAP